MAKAAVSAARSWPPNPTCWTPSFHKADSILGDRVFGGHLKVHRLRFKWKAAYSLAWMCSDSPGERNVEIEATIYPESPRISENWESNDAREYTQTNMPGNIHQDDIASSDNPLHGGNPLDKQKYPDFAIVAQSSRDFKYGRRYRVDFTTDQGETDQGRVIYSAQPTHRASSGSEKNYCRLRFSDYKSCMFSKVDLCFNQAFLSEGPVSRQVDWAARLGYLSRLADVARRHPDQVKGREVRTFCDPREEGAGDT